MSAGAGIALTALLLMLNAFFVGAEFALVAARRSALEPLVEAGSRRAARTVRAMEQVSLMMAGAQLGITVCSLALGAVSEPAIAHLLEPGGRALGLPGAAVHTVAFLVALALVTLLHVVLGEMVPKNVTLAGPEAAALWLGPPLAALVRALKPVIVVLNASANLVLRLLRVHPRAELASTVTRDELTGLVEHSHREGLLGPGERSLLAGAISFETATAADVTVPLARVHALGADPSAADVERLAARTGVTRFPIRDGGRLCGYVHLKDVLRVPDGARHRPLPAATIRPLPSVAADLPLSDAIETMRARQAHLARVTAPGPGPDDTIGVITLDDVLAALTRP